MSINVWKRVHPRAKARIGRIAWGFQVFATLTMLVALGVILIMKPMDFPPSVLLRFIVVTTLIGWGLANVAAVANGACKAFKSRYAPGFVAGLAGLLSFIDIYIFISLCL